MIAEAIERAAAVLREAPSVALACHVNPDPDALGSMLGLSTHLRERGTQTVCSFPNDPFDPPRWLDLLPGRDALVHPREFPDRPAVMVTCDAAAMDRLAMLGHQATHAETVIWIDHHRSNPGLGTIPVIDPDASSTCELVARLVVAIGGPMSAATATALYAGLITDTGRFQYEAVRPETLRLAAELRTLPFDHARLAQALYEDNSAAYLRFLGTALQRMRIEDGLVWTWVTREDLAESGVDIAETAVFLALQAAGLTVVDGQQAMMRAREIKNQDEITLLTQACAMVDGVYQDIFEFLKPGIRESDVVALAHARLFEMGSEFVEAINSIAGERCAPHPHVFSDRLIRPGDQAYFDIIHVFNGYRTCYYRTLAVGSASRAQRASRAARACLSACLRARCPPRAVPAGCGPPRHNFWISSR